MHYSPWCHKESEASEVAEHGTGLGYSNSQAELRQEADLLMWQGKSLNIFSTWHFLEFSHIR